MPRKRTRRFTGGAAGDVSGSTAGSSVGGDTMSINVGAPKKIKAIRENPNQVVCVALLFILFILTILVRQFVDVGVIWNKLSISVVAFTLGAGLIGYYLLIGGQNEGLVVDMYLYFSLIAVGYWLWLLFFSDGFIDKQRVKNTESEEK